MKQQSRGLTRRALTRRALTRRALTRRALAPLGAAALALTLLGAPPGQAGTTTHNGQTGVINGTAPTPGGANTPPPPS